MSASEKFLETTSCGKPVFVGGNDRSKLLIIEWFGAKIVHSSIQSFLFALGIAVGGHADNEKMRTTRQPLVIQ